jgi:hypothetical protein
MLGLNAKFAFRGLLLIVLLMVLPPLALAGPPVKEEIKDSIKAIVKDTPEGTSAVVEITIDESGIRLRTQEGKEYTARVDEKSRIVITENGIIVGDVRIPEGLGDVEKIKMLEELKNFGVVIEDEEDGKDIIRWGSDIIVGEGEVVTGDIVALWGDVTVKGTVNGSVFAVSGDIYITSDGYIRQGATAVGGKIEVDPGGQIHGEEVEIPLHVKFLGGSLGQERLRLLKESEAAGRLGFAIVALVFILIAITVILSLMPRNVERIKNRISQDFLKSFLFGYLIFVGVIVAFIFLVITVVGIPIAILLPLFLVFMLALGLTATCLFFGEKLRGPMNISTTSNFYTAFLGALAIQSFLIVAAIFGMVWPLGLLGGLLTALWVILFFFLVAPASLGGVILARFGAAPSSKGQAQVEEPTMSPPGTPEDQGGGDSQAPAS